MLQGFKKVYHFEESGRQKKFYDDYDHKKYHYDHDDYDQYYKHHDHKDYKGDEFKVKTIFQNFLFLQSAILFVSIYVGHFYIKINM